MYSEEKIKEEDEMEADTPLPLWFKVILWAIGIILVSVMIMSAAGVAIKSSIRIYMIIAAVLGLIILSCIGIFKVSRKNPVVGILIGAVGIIVFIFVSEIILFMADDDSLTIKYEGKEYAALRSQDFHHPSYSLYEDFSPVFRGTDKIYVLKESGDETGGYVLTEVSSGMEIQVNWDYYNNKLSVMQ